MNGIYEGTTAVNNLQIGTTNVNQVYHGTDKVWPPDFDTHILNLDPIELWDCSQALATTPPEELVQDLTMSRLNTTGVSPSQGVFNLTGTTTFGAGAAWHESANHDTDFDTWPWTVAIVFRTHSSFATDVDGQIRPAYGIGDNDPTDGGDYGFWIGTGYDSGVDSNTRLGVKAGSSAGSTFNTTLSTSTDYLLIVTYDTVAGKYEGYINNGSLLTTAALPAPNHKTTDRVYLGTARYNVNYEFTHHLCRVAHFNRKLTADERSSIWYSLQ